MDYETLAEGLREKAGMNLRSPRPVVLARGIGEALLSISAELAASREDVSLGKAIERVNEEIDYGDES